eukprot:4647630-Prymnesium_polylepis.1
MLSVSNSNNRPSSLGPKISTTRTIPKQFPPVDRPSLFSVSEFENGLLPRPIEPRQLPRPTASTNCPVPQPLASVPEMTVSASSVSPNGM